MHQLLSAAHRAFHFGMVAAVVLSLLPASAVIAQPAPSTPALPEFTSEQPQPPPIAPLAGRSRIPPDDFVPPPLRAEPVPQRDPKSRPGVLPDAQIGLPLAFRPNDGRGPLADRFTTTGPGWSATFAAETVTLAFNAAPTGPTLVGKAARFALPQAPRTDTLGPPPAPTTVTLRFVGARSRSQLQGLSRVPARARVFRTQPRSDAALYHRLRYRALYPGIALTYQSVEGQLKSIYEVAPRSDPGLIRWRYEGAGPVTLDRATGQLHIQHPADHQHIIFREQRPVAWQETKAGLVFVDVSYWLDADGTVRFVLGAYDQTLPLIIDPVLTTSSYLGGSGEDQGSGIAVDSSGNLYLAITTGSTDLPTVNPLFGPNIDPCSSYEGWCYEIWVGKFSPDGQTLLAATYVGGTENDYVNDLALGPDGRVYLVGETASTDFPVVNALQPALSSVLPYERDAFVVALEPDLSAVSYATYLGGEGYDGAHSVAVDQAGAVSVVGSTYAATFPVTAGAFDITCGNDGACGALDNDGYTASDTFVVKLSATGSSIIYATYLGGECDDEGYAIAVDSQGEAYLAGSTSSEDFPIEDAIQTSLNDENTDGFVTHLAADGSSLIASTYFGGFADDIITGIVVSAAGDVIVTGSTESWDFPIANAYQAECDAYYGETSAHDAFVASLSAGGTALRYSTCLGSWSNDTGADVALDSTGNVYVTGTTSSARFPVVQPWKYQRGRVSDGSWWADWRDEDAFVAAFAPDGQNVYYNTYYGGPGYDAGLALTASLTGTVYVTGATGVYAGDTDFPTVEAYQSLFNGGGTDAFVGRFSPPLTMPLDQGYCPVCGAAAAPQPTTPYPVSTRSGNFSTSVTDISVGTPGPAVSWSRIYVSQGIDAIDAGFGVGWHHPYAVRLILPSMPTGEADRVILRASNGNRERFSSLGGGQYEAFPGVYGTLVESGGSFVLTQRDQSVLTFDATTGLLQSLTNPQGEEVELVYSGGKLTQVRDAANTQRALTLTYDTSDPSLIAAVSDGTRTVSYSYTNGDLTEVLDVMGRPTTYVYQSHLLTEIKNALGQTLEAMSYDLYTSAGKVISQTLQDGRQFAFEYLPATTVITTTGPGDATEVMRYDYSAGNVLNGMARNDQALTTTVFDPSLSPGTIVDANGNAIETVYTENGLPLSRTDATGQTTLMEYDSLNRPVVMTDTLGLRTELAYDSASNVISQTTSITGTFPGFTSVYTYNVRYPGQNWLEDTVGPDGVQTRYEYDSDGQRIAVTINYDDGVYDQNAPDEDLRTSYGYDAFGRVVTTTVGVGTALQRADVTEYNLDGSVARSIQNYDDGVFDPQYPAQDIVAEYGYDDLGRQVWVKNALGRYDATHYDAAGRADWTIQNLMPFQVDADGLPIFQAFDSAAPAANVATLYAYDGLGRTTLVTETGLLDGSFDPLTRSFSGETTRTTFTEYDDQSRPITVTLNYQPALPAGPDVNVQTLTRYDVAGNVIGQRDALGRWTHTEYDALNRPITVTLNYENGDPLSICGDGSPGGSDWWFCDADQDWALDDNTAWATITDTDLIQVTAYRPDGRVDDVIEGYVDGIFDAAEPDRDRKTAYVYDELGRQTQTIQNYVDGDPNTGTLNTDLITATAYDAVGRVQATGDPLGQYRSLLYDAAGRVTHSIQNCRDGSSDPVATGCAAFNPNVPDRNVPGETRYDALGRSFETVDALGHITRQEYDGAGRVVTTIQNYVDRGPVNSDTNVASSRAYDALGRTTVITDALGAASFQAYNALGHTTVMTDAVGRASFAGYEGMGTLRWQETPDGRFTVQQRDGLGRMVATITNYADGVVGGSEPVDQDLITSTVYDAAGRTVATIDAAGRETRFTYDLRDNLLSVTENAADGSCSLAPCNVLTSYAYDRAGNRISITDANSHTRTFAFDAAGRQVSETDALSQTTSYSYDRRGRLTFRDDPRGGNYDVTYSYDELARPTGMSATELDAPLSLAYNALGWRTSLSDSTGSTSFAYDALGRTTVITAPVTGAVGYGYNARGQRTQLTYPDSTIIEYTYWDDGQLEEVQQGSTALSSYAYDAAGRLETTTRANGATTSYSYNGADRLTDLSTVVSSTTVLSFSYALDRLGLRTGVTEVLSGTRAISYTYDGLNRLAGALESPGAVYTYTYDLAGNRTQAWENSTQVQSRSYDAANQVVGWSYDAAGNLLSDGSTTSSYDALSRLTSQDGRAYSYNGDGVLVAQTVGITTTNYTQDLAAPLSQVLNDGNASYIYANGPERLRTLGGPWYVGDALGSVRATLDDAGAAIAIASYDPWGVPQGGMIAPFGFTGELQDATNGMVHLRARWYDAGEGQFHVRDPFAGWPEKPYSQHHYQYGYSNPLNYFDPTGHLAIFVMGGWNGVYQAIGQGNSVVKLAETYGSRIPGSDFLSSADTSIPAPFTPDTHDKIASTIAEVYHDTCGQEPIVVLGYSRGGSTVQRAMEILNNENPEVRVDLVITFGMVHAANFAGADLNRQMPNVIKHLNFMSEQANAAIPPGGDYPDKIFGHPERSIRGAEEYTVEGTDHFTVIDETIHPYYDKSKEDNPPLGPPPPPIRNPAWDIMDKTIDVLVKTLGPRPYNPRT